MTTTECPPQVKVDDDRQWSTLAERLTWRAEPSNQRRHAFYRARRAQLRALNPDDRQWLGQHGFDVDYELRKCDIELMLRSVYR